MITSEKNGELTAILFPREFMRARLVNGLGSNWTEARIGMYFSVVSGTSKNDLPDASESLAVADNSDYITLGLKDSGSLANPGDAGSLFLGVRSTGTTSLATTSLLADSNGECSAVGCAGTTIIDGGVLQNGAFAFPDPSPEEGFCAFYSVKFRIQNRGSSSQSVGISVARSSAVSGVDYSRIALLQLMNNSTYGAEKIISWNSGGSARNIPDSAWMRFPFYLYRIRVQAFMAIKTSP